MSRYELTKAKYLLDEEVEHLTSTLTRFQNTDARNCTLIWLALLTGGRASELLALTPNDLDHAEKSVFIRGLKGSRDRELPIPPWLFNKLTELTPEDGRLFPITYVRFYQIWCEYRPVKKKLHALRHTFAITLYRKTKDLHLIQQALGHKSVSNTLIYSQFQYRMPELRRAMVG
jgi:integrase/recombinase XerC